MRRSSRSFPGRGGENKQIAGFTLKSLVPDGTGRGPVPLLLPLATPCPFCIPADRYFCSIGCVVRAQEALGDLCALNRDPKIHHSAVRNRVPENFLERDSLLLV